MKLYLADIKSVKLEHMALISSERAKRVSNLKMLNDKKRGIAGGLLLRKFLGDALITVTDKGKPVADNGKCFNLSHSGNYVLLALADFDVGCDIEKIRHVNPEKMGRIVFCQNEIERIVNSPDRTGEFFKLWTKKESLLKCMGEGFYRGAKTVDVSGDCFTENGKSYFIKTWCFADYTVSVCSRENNLAKNIEFVNLENENFI